MSAKVLSILAAVIGSLCVAYALLWQYEAMSVVAVYPFAAGGMDSRYFWWPFCTGGVLLALACFGFLSRIVSHRKHGRETAA